MCELQQQYDEVRAARWTTATTQRLAKLQEAKHFITQVEAVQKKEGVFKARLGTRLDEAYVVSANIREKLVNLQRKKQ